MRIACLQRNVVFGDHEANAARTIAELPTLAVKGVELAILPEAYLTGYCVSSPEQARQIAIEDVSPVFADLSSACVSLGVSLIVGFAERRGQTLLNSALLLRSDGSREKYSKTHIPCMGLDRFVDPGDSLPVFDVGEAKVGILICFDLRPPEAARTLCIKGADLVVLPTNWPTGAEASPRVLAIARAIENKVYVAACNRIGEENGFKFIGESTIIDPLGEVLSRAGREEETLIADIDLDVPRNKRRVVIPGEYETTILESRRPELYGALCE